MPEHTLADGRRIRYTTAGGGTPVLVLPDAEPDAAARHPLLNAGVNGARIIVPALDMAGSRAQVSADAAALLAALDAAPAAVLGFGAGAGLALHLAAAHGQVVHRVIADSPQLMHTPEALLGDVMCHVLLVWCDPDPAVPQSEKGRIALQIPRAQRVDYPAGRGAYAAHPERFLGDVAAWLRRDVPAAVRPMNEEPETPARGPVVFDA